MRVERVWDTSSEYDKLYMNESHTSNNNLECMILSSLPYLDELDMIIYVIMGFLRGIYGSLRGLIVCVWVPYLLPIHTLY